MGFAAMRFAVLPAFVWVVLCGAKAPNSAQNVALFREHISVTSRRSGVRCDLRPPCITPFANRHEGEPNTRTIHTPAGYICMSRTSAFVLRAAGVRRCMSVSGIWLGGRTAGGHWALGGGSWVTRAGAGGAHRVASSIDGRRWSRQHGDHDHGAYFIRITHTTVVTTPPQPDARWQMADGVTDEPFDGAWSAVCGAGQRASCRCQTERARSTIWD
jgi:hypothetical protein